MTGLLPVRFTGNRLAIYFTSVRQTNVSAMKCTKTKQNRVRFLREWSKPSISRRICQSFAKQFFHYMSAKTWEAPLPPSPLSFSPSLFRHRLAQRRFSAHALSSRHDYDARTKTNLIASSFNTAWRVREHETHTYARLWSTRRGRESGTFNGA